MSLSNNSEHGKNFQQDLYLQMCLLFERKILKRVERNFGVRHPGYSSSKQYYAPIMITRSNGEDWAIFTTTSCRTDRLKGQQWDADHLKAFCSTITKVFVVYPDEVDQKVKKAFIDQQRKYDNKWEYSRIDQIVSASELVTRIVNG